MLIYLVRHGEALSEQEDPLRSLSSVGRRNMRVLGDHLARHMKMLPGHIFHSSKVRAAETAELIARSLGSGPAPLQAEGLLPMDDPGIWAEELSSYDRDIMLVGHLPHLSRLASLLLTWDAGKEIADFTPGAILCIEKTATCRVKWMLSPRVLKGEKK